MFTRGLETFLEEPLELFERLSLDTSEDLYVLERELKRCGFESDVARRVGEHETEVDMDEVSVSVDQNVAVVAILDLQQVCNDGVTWSCVSVSMRLLHAAASLTC